jgi:hypothetical protein
MKPSAICTIAIIIISSINLSGQGTDTINNGRLSLGIKSISFIKNNEYFNPIDASQFVLPSNLPQRADKSLWIEGYTLTGAFLQPELVYRTNSGITLKAGVHLLKYSGSDSFYSAKPLLSASYDFSEKSRLTIGSFSSDDRHGLFDPAYDRERLYTENAEEGLLFTFRSDKAFNDTWIDWEEFIFKGDTTQEVFNFGESFKYSFNIIPEVLNAELPVQIMFRHYGGQISDAPHPVMTFFNMSAGLRMNYAIASKRYGEAGLEYLYFRNSVIPQREAYTLRHGSASWFRFHYNYRRIYFGTYYWKSEDFFAPLGNGIYASIFNFQSDYIIHSRRVMTNAFYYTFLPEKFFELQFGAESYYDIREKRLDYSLLLHLSLNKLFSLAKNL